MTILYAIIGGLLPALIWLWFWMQEDKVNPEPGIRIAKAFIAGMLVVPVVLIIQVLVAKEVLGASSVHALTEAPASVAAVAILLLAGVEEVLKYVAARAVALGSPDDDEPVDSVIYMIVAALGFSAMENALYFVAPLLDSDYVSFLVDGNLRFLGATLVHVSSSAIVGMAVAFTVFRFSHLRFIALVTGLVAATALHGAYNFLIIADVQARTIAFILVWSACVSLIVLFEKIKQVHLNPITPSYEEA
jgi:RsiW-degrading membrane proteinase PrsW (M82 family)